MLQGMYVYLIPPISELLQGAHSVETEDGSPQCAGSAVVGGETDPARDGVDFDSRRRQLSGVHQVSVGDAEVDSVPRRLAGTPHSGDSTCRRVHGA